MEKSFFSQIEIFRDSWNFMKKQGVTMVGLFLAYTVLSVVINFLSGNEIYTWRYFLGLLFTLVLSFGFEMGYSKLTLNILDGIEPDIDVFRSIWSRAWTYLKLQILIWIIMIISAMIAFIVIDMAINVPSLIFEIMSPAGFLILGIMIIFLFWFFVRISFAGLIILDTDLSWSQALRRSWRITSGHMWKLVMLWFLVLVLNIFGLIALIIGVFFTLAMSQFIYVIAYRKLWMLYQEKENEALGVYVGEDYSI